MATPKSGSFYVAECLVVVTYPPAPETVTMIDKKVAFAVATDTTNVWHRTFGHLGTKAIVATSKKEIVLGIPNLEEDKYESSLFSGSALGNFDRKPFRSSGRHSSEPCARIYKDIKRPMEVTAIGMYKYFRILGYDYCGFTKAFSLINKSEALKFYKSFCEHAWNLLNKRVTYLRCYNSKKFEKYLSDQGTVLDEIPDYTPQLN
jgi:hypothetical protein